MFKSTEYDWQFMREEKEINKSANLSINFWYKYIVDNINYVNFQINTFNPTDAAIDKNDFLIDACSTRLAQISVP